MTPPNTSTLNPHVSVDCAVFGIGADGLQVLLIEREHPVNTSGRHFQLPGDLIRNDENLDQAAQRVLTELTGLDNVYLEQFAAFGDPARAQQHNDLEWLRQIRKEPDARVVTVGYFSLIKPENFSPHANSFARKAEWVTITDVPPLAFDHDLVLSRALEKLRERARTSSVAFELLPRKFTLGHLQNVYEAISGTKLDKRNFRRTVLSAGFVEPLAEKQNNVAHKPAQLFRFDRRKFQRLREQVI